jgi:hypothetical protein
MSLTHTILQREAPNSEKVLRRILHQDEIWYWDPSSNEIDKITSQRTKKELKREKKQRAKTEKRQKKEQKTEKKMKKGRHAEPSASRKALATSGKYLLRFHYRKSIFLLLHVFMRDYRRCMLEKGRDK